MLRQNQNVYCLRRKHSAARLLHTLQEWNEDCQTYLPLSQEREQEQQVLYRLGGEEFTVEVRSTSLRHW